MNVIYGATPKEKASVFSAFKPAIERQPFSGTLFLAFPIVDISGASSAVDALLISEEEGLVVFDLEPLAALDVQKVRSRQDDIYVGLQSRFIRHDSLRLDRRRLAFEIKIFTFAPFISDSSHLDADLNIHKTTDSLFAALKKDKEQLSMELAKHLTAVIQAVDKIRGKKQIREGVAPESRASILAFIEGQIANLDRFQNKAIVETTESPQRIRGLAGCGKTIVLASKAAYLHATNRELTIVVTFYTRALYGHLRNLIQRFFSAYTNSFDGPDWTHLKLMHAWGSPGNPGVYFDIAGKNGFRASDWQTALQTYGMNSAFTGVCNELERSLSSPAEIYDIVIVDEAQDMPTSFFRSVYASTRGTKRIIWAYDELQKLDSEETMPPPEELFGSDDQGRRKVSLQNESGKPDQDIVLPVCYRNPKEILVTAHALGFAIYRSAGLIQMINDADLWTDIGYEFIQGEPQAESRVVLARRSDASPEFLSEHDKRYPIVNTSKFSFIGEQATWIAEQIRKNLADDQLVPTDIMVIHPDPRTTKSAAQAIQRELTQRGIPSHVAGVGLDRDEFLIPGSVVISHIFRAKGNEAAVVYIFDSHLCSDGNELIKKRNVLFTAITRARAWVYICGVGKGMDTIESEVESVREHDYKLEFEWPPDDKLEKMRNLHRELTPEEKQVRTKGKKSVVELVKLIGSGKLTIDDLPPEDVAALRNLLGKK